VRRVSPPLFVALVLVPIAGCGRPIGPSSGTGTAASLTAPDLGPVVARVGEVPIHAAEVTAQAQRTGRPARQALDELIRFQLLAERARQRPGPASAPEPPPDSLLVQRLLERDLEPALRPQDIPDEDLRRAYEQVKGHYVRPRMVEVGLLSVYTGESMKPEPRARAQETARMLEQHLARTPPPNIEAFAALAGTPPWSERKVRYWRFWQGPTRDSGPFGGKVAPAIQRLKHPGERSGRIDDESGYHFAWYLSEQGPKHVPFEAARDEIRAKFHPTWRQQRFKQVVGQLGAGHKIEVYPDRLFTPGGS
jgi:hypothetical protein